jgi:hypothetical protein
MDRETWFATFAIQSDDPPTILMSFASVFANFRAD